MTKNRKTAKDLVKRKSARDLVLARTAAPSLQGVLDRARYLHQTRQVGVAIPGTQRVSHQLGKLRKSIGGDYAPLIQIPGDKPYVRRDSDVVREEQRRMQARSELFVESIKRRLLGQKIGAPLRTKQDVEILKDIHDYGEKLAAESRVMAARKQRLQQELTGQLGWLSRSLKRIQSGAISTAQGIQSLWQSGKQALEQLRGDVLKSKLRGLGLLPATKIPTEMQSASGFERDTPKGSQMTAVSSSNVASIGWDPMNPEEEPKQDTLGKLFIQFRNGWLYQYANAPFWLFEALLRSPSKGKAVWTLIRRGLYPDGIPYGSLSREGYERIV